ncbi:MAG TPA: universal stress protein [Pseudolabrys sp.]|jgi:nucleotide-binding universal stress UspA family protein|nr:universal stress protein [Pseudolabrys sp.]
MIKDIIVSLGLGERDPAGDYALSLAQAFAAHVLGAAFAYDVVIPGLAMDGGIPPEFIETQRAQAESRAGAAMARFEAAAKRAGVSYESRLMNASVSGAAGEIARLARRFDLAVLGQAVREEPASDQVLGEGVLFDSGRPVIFVPFIQKAAMTLNHVMICWDGSRAATRAIADSMPLLEKAKQIEVVIVAANEAQSNELPGVDLGQHLARHGLNVDVKRMTAPDIDVAATILSYAADTGTDLIVMGGYGHSRLREFVLGGVTRAILDSMTVPVLMSH